MSFGIPSKVATSLAVMMVEGRQYLGRLCVLDSTSRPLKSRLSIFNLGSNMFSVQRNIISHSGDLQTTLAQSITRVASPWNTLVHQSYIQWIPSLCRGRLAMLFLPGGYLSRTYLLLRTVRGASAPSSMWTPHITNERLSPVVPAATRRATGMKRAPEFW